MKFIGCVCWLVVLSWGVQTALAELELRETDAVIEVWASDSQMLMRYHKQESEVPEGMSKDYRRSGYLHPVQTLDGRTVTGDFAEDHPHQHGVFLAWTSGNYAGRKVDFWNAQKGEGRVAHQRVCSREEGGGRVSFEVELSHFDEREGGVEVLKETWKVTVHSVGEEHYVFDVESRQVLVAPQPLLVEKYHYGGMAVRGNAAWLGEGGCEMRTSGKLDRVKGNHSRPNWVGMFGRLAGKPAGIVMMGHPKNFRAPQWVRIHPEKPYFCFAPMVEEEFSIEKGSPLILRYRFLVGQGEFGEAEVNDEWERYSEVE